MIQLLVIITYLHLSRLLPCLLINWKTILSQLLVLERKKWNGICSTYHQLARTRGKSRSKPPLAAYPPAILGFSFASGRIHWDPAFASGKRCANYRPIAAENPALWRVDHTIGCAPITISRPFLRWPRKKNKTQNDVSKFDITEIYTNNWLSQNCTRRNCLSTWICV